LGQVAGSSRQISRWGLPCSRQFNTAKDGQRPVLVQIVVGESPSANDCTPIGRCTAAHLSPGLPAKSPMNVRFHYQSDGRMKVRVKVPQTDQQLETAIVRENGLPKEHMDAWRQYISGQKPTDYR
jgi:molecular chaperone DnaK